MNVSDDGQPVGENPAVGGFQIFGTDHLRGNVVEKIIGEANKVRDEAERKTLALNEIREYAQGGAIAGRAVGNAVVERQMLNVLAILEAHGLA